MISRVTAQFELHKINPQSAKFVAGVSGGIDSMVMLYILKQLNCDVVAVHVNYKKRGEDSERDAALVKTICQEYGFDFRCFEYQSDDITSGNFQESARNYRRQKFINTAYEIGANHILLAHHLDDQIETIIQKLFKGAGLNSVTGMNVLEGRYFRPLLHISRDEIETFARIQNVKWNDDTSNKDTSYARNWIRSEFSQSLDGFFPGWRENILKHASRLEAINELLDISVNEIKSSTNELSLSALENKSAALQMVILHHWLHQSHIFTSEGTLEQIHRLLTASQGAKVIINEHYELFRERDKLILVECSNPMTSIVHRITKNDLKNGVIKLSHQNQQIVIQLNNVNQNGQTIQELSPPDDTSVESSEYLKKSYPEVSIDRVGKPTIDNRNSSRYSESPNRLILDADMFNFPLFIQRWEHGDKFKPLGMNTAKLVSDLLTDRKIDSSLKNNAIKITDFDGKICAIIFPHPTSNGQAGNIGEDFKVTEQTNSIIEIIITQQQ
jgi:tRNA(Ile)-lysidine synthase